jgi:hypothetical protein
MKKTILNILVLLISCLMASPARAGQDQILRANVPFDFIIGTTTFPAGAYSVAKDSPSGSLWVQSRTCNRAYILQTIPLAPPDFSGKPRLVFNRHGSAYFLSQVVSDKTGKQGLIKSKREREMALASLLHQTVTVDGNQMR